MRAIWLGLAAGLVAVTAWAQAPDAPEGPFRLGDLPYAYGALQPVIDAETMQLHHQRHHGGQVAALNAEVAKTPELGAMTLEQILGQVSKYAPAVRNNAGGAWNHDFFWRIMAPAGQGGEPSPELLAAITNTFGSLDAMKAEFRKAGLGRFGSGWVWLVVTEDGKLAITSTPNQDNPLMDVAETRGTPILGNDLWEHAYYLSYRNKRADYLDAWWGVVNWAEVSRRYAAAVEG